MPKPDEELEDLEDETPADEESPDTEPESDEEEAEEEPSDEDTSDEAEGVEEDQGETGRLKRELAELKEEKARLLNDSAYYRNLFEESRRGTTPKPAEKEEETPLVTAEEYYADPVKASMKIADLAVQRFVKKQQEGAVTNYRENMKRAYGEGRAGAIRSYPKLMKGVEREVEDYVFEAIKNQRLTDPQDARNPEVWAIAAESVRRSKGELDFSKYYQQENHQGPASEPPWSELPSRTRRSPGTSRRLQLDDEAKIFIEEINRGEKKKITEEEIAKSMGYDTPRRPNPFKKKEGARR